MWSFVPRPFTTVIMATEMPAAINPYSMTLRNLSGKRPTARMHLRPCLPKSIQKTVLSDLKTFIAVIGGKPIDKKNAILLLQRLGYDQDQVIQEFVKVLIGEAEIEGSCSPSIRKMPITITTVQGSKGLAADYVFITNFDERYVGKGGVTTQSICNFLVALTRARKKVWLLSTSDKPSPFLSWIDGQKIESR